MVMKMSALTSGRRAGKTASLLIAALAACSLVLGFNYWVSSSLSMQLQTRLYQMESQVRHEESERESSELKNIELENKLQRELEQMIFIQNSYRTHEEDAENMCNQDKAILQQNISSSSLTILQLRDQLNIINNQFVVLTDDLRDCEGNAKDQINKCLADRGECQVQLQTTTQQCAEKVAAVQLELEEKIKIINTAVLQSQEKASDDGVKEEGAAPLEDKQVIIEIDTDKEQQSDVKNPSDAVIDQDDVVQSNHEENVENENVENENVENENVEDENAENENAENENAENENAENENVEDENVEMENAENENAENENAENENVEDENAENENAENENVEDENAEMENGEWRDVELENGEMENGEMENGAMENGEWRDVELENVELENGEMENGEMENGAMENGAMENGEWRDVELENVELENGEMENAEMDDDVENEHPEIQVDAALEDPRMPEMLGEDGLNEVNQAEDYESNERALDNRQEEMGLVEENDYNGDEDNRGEFEADRQDELDQL